MRPLLIVFALSMSAFQNQDIPNKEQQIAGALQAVPENLREGATVYGYDSKGKVIILQKGSGLMVCLADNPHMSGFISSAFHKDLYPFMARGLALRLEGKSAKEIFDIREAEAKSGKLRMPEKATTLYVLFGTDGTFDEKERIFKNVRLRYVVYIPWATQETTGLPTKPTSPGGPWIMNPGTHRAHIMITPPVK